jgi:MYXO-CTERM domain-containing protein
MGDVGVVDAGSDIGNAGSDSDGGDTTPDVEDNGCSCASTSSVPNPAAALYVLLGAFGIGVLRRRSV